MKTARTRFLDLYKFDDQGNASININSLNPQVGQSGCYIIKDPFDNICYIGYSASNLYKTITRHFQHWSDKSRLAPRIVYPKQGYKVKIIYCSPSNAWALEKYLINKYRPADNEQKYQNYLTQSQENKAKDMYEEDLYIKNAPTDIPF